MPAISRSRQRPKTCGSTKPSTSVSLRRPCGGSRVSCGEFVPAIPCPSNSRSVRRARRARRIGEASCSPWGWLRIRRALTGPHLLQSGRVRCDRRALVRRPPQRHEHAEGSRTIPWRRPRRRRTSLDWHTAFGRVHGSPSSRILARGLDSTDSFRSIEALDRECLDRCFPGDLPGIVSRARTVPCIRSGPCVPQPSAPSGASTQRAGTCPVAALPHPPIARSYRRRSF